MLIPSLIQPRFARSITAEASRNALTLRRVKIRFQFAGGADDTLGIEGARWTLTSGKSQVGTGRTAANGEVSFLMSSSETLVLQIFGTQYNVSLHALLQAVTELSGQQKRLDGLGYMAGYQSTPIGDDEPDDGDDGARTRQATLNLQTDSAMAMDSVMGQRTRQKLEETFGA
ncbi:MAG: hypothetical protein ACJAS1_005489 [Oleiphilaceae bacterium]|jgi:hypothetical protein